MASHHTIPHIVEITRDHPHFAQIMDRLEEICALALKDDPLTLPTVGASYSEDPGRHHRFVRMQLEVGLIGGHIYGAFLGDISPANLVGMSMWYEPGTEFMESEGERGPWNAYMRDLSPEIKQWMDEIMFPRVNSLAVESFGNIPKSTMFQLQLLAVHPDFHRRGLGTALCKRELGKADKMGISSCLETNSDDNIKFYTSLGFTVKGSVLMPSRLGDFTMSCMHRPPVASNVIT
ncbi:hypothetical protein BDV93DRAFT_601396 [Ceratobasidium sp. AG-I]|nr:hypothetical protein BDV93DRAFT_601396 [Ceratobasidium sp. AG-I]